MANRINVNLDTNKNIYDIFECKQNDDLILEANIFENGLGLNITNKEVTINCNRADGTFVIQNTEITKENNKIIANLKRDFTRVGGLDKLEIVLTENGKQNTTFDFNILVKNSVISGAVESTNTATILEELGNKIVEAGQVKAETEALIQNGGAATKGDIANVNSQLEQKANLNDVAKISSGTPLFASSTSGMTDIAKNYVNTTDGYLYIYSGGNWNKTSVQYQSTGITDKSITYEKLSFMTKGKNLVDIKSLNLSKRPAQTYMVSTKDEFIDTIFQHTSNLITLSGVATTIYCRGIQSAHYYNNAGLWNGSVSAIAVANPDYFKLVIPSGNYYARLTINANSSIVPLDTIVAVLSEVDINDKLYGYKANSDMIIDINSINGFTQEVNNVINNSINSSSKLVPTNTICLLGDSFTAQNGLYDDIPSYGTASFYNSAIGYFTWANVLLGQKLKVLKNFGIGGYTTSQMLAKVPDVIALKPSYCLVLGGINDELQNIPIATQKANLESIYKQLISAGIIVIGCTITPRSDFVTVNKNNLLNTNNWIRSQTSVLKNFILCDWYNDIADPNTDIPFTNPIVTKDVVHPSVIGAYRMGLTLADVLRDKVNDRGIFAGGNSDTTNPFKNAYMLGGTTIAPNWVIGDTNATYVANKVTREKGLEWQEINVTSVNATSITIKQSATSGFSVGDKVSAYIEFEIDSSATDIDSYYAILKGKNSSGGTPIASTGLQINSVTVEPLRFHQNPTSGIIYCPRFTITSDVVELQLEFTAKLKGKFRIGRTRVVKE